MEPSPPNSAPARALGPTRSSQEVSEMPLDPSGSWMRREPSLQPQTLTAHCPRPLSAVFLGSGGGLRMPHSHHRG